MIINILGAFDIIAAIVLFLTPFVSFQKSLLLIFAFYLGIKGFFFLLLGGFEFNYFLIANVTDIFTGVIFYLTIPFTLPKILIAASSLFLAQKGVTSLL